MAQLGEPVHPGEFVSALEHDESSCPWHEKKEAKADAMEIQDPDEDVDIMPPNLGTALGKNLGERARDKISIAFRKGEVVTYGSGKKKNIVQSYEQLEFEEAEYDLQYAPHHLVPGNESLKESGVVPYLGDDDVIAHFKGGGAASQIKKGKTAGYNVNRAENGVWLPSPYAVSNANCWPAAAGIKALVRIKGKLSAKLAEDFQDAYVAAAIDAASSGDDEHQFHMRHKDYSDKVRQVLNSIGDRLEEFAYGDKPCPEAAKTKEDDKVDPPGGLTARLDKLSGNLRRLLTGSVWRPPLFTDTNLMMRYFKNKKIVETEGLKGTIEKII